MFSSASQVCLAWLAGSHIVHSLRFYRSVPCEQSLLRSFSACRVTDRLITTGNRQQTTTDPVHSHGEINRSRHRHRLKNGLRWLTFSTDVSKLLIIGCFVCSHDRHHFLTLCQIYSITDKVQHSLQTRNLNLTATNEIRFADR